MQKGISFIEMLIVIAVIGAITAIAIPAYKATVTRSLVASAVNTVLPLRSSTDIYILKEGHFPSNTMSSAIGIPTTPLGKINLVPFSSAVGSIEFVFSSSLNNTALRSKRFFLKREHTGIWKCTSYSVVGYVDLNLMPKGCGN